MSEGTNHTDIHHLIRLAAIWVAINLSGCAHGLTSWVWDHPDPDYALCCKDQDIFRCEGYAKEVAMGGPLHENSNARDFGGWGNFDFEFCMNEKGWRLVQHNPGRISH